MKSESRAVIFGLVCGAVGFALGLARHGDLARAAVGGAIGLAIGFLLMQALRGRP